MQEGLHTKIVLLGYMASGKSVVGKLLAAQLNIPFVDLDAHIAHAKGQSIPEIFAAEGELAFRKMEHAHLKTLLSSSQAMVLSLGGGTPCYFNHMKLMQATPDVISVYLKVGIPTLVARLLIEKEQRPLIAHLDSEAALTEFVGKHLFERSPFYSRATHEVVVNEAPPQQVADTIISLLA